MCAVRRLRRWRGSLLGGSRAQRRHLRLRRLLASGADLPGELSGAHTRIADFGGIEPGGGFLQELGRRQQRFVRVILPGATLSFENLFYRLCHLIGRLIRVIAA